MTRSKRTLRSHATVFMSRRRVGQVAQENIEDINDVMELDDTEERIFSLQEDVEDVMEHEDMEDRARVQG